MRLINADKLIADLINIPNQLDIIQDKIFSKKKYSLLGGAEYVQ